MSRQPTPGAARGPERRRGLKVCALATGHADIAVACVLRFTGEAHPQLFNAARYPALSAHAARCEALAPFKEIVQPLVPPSG